MTDALDCGHASASHAFDPEGHSLCYASAYTMEREFMARANAMVAYVSGNGTALTTWPGGELARITRHVCGRHGFNRSEIHYIRATAPDGSQWYGRNGGNGMSILVHRAKTREKVR